MARKNNSSKKEIAEILANFKLDNEISSYYNEKQRKTSSKKERREFSKWKSERFVPKSFCLYKTQNSKNVYLKELGVQLIKKNIISKYGSQKPTSIGKPLTNPSLRLSPRHFPSLVPSIVSKKMSSTSVCIHIKNLFQKRNPDTKG